jgi:tetratricopeptide (TPR) repeat protein
MQLVGIYSNLGASDKITVDQQRSYYARAINAAEHAQRLGFLNTPKDNFNLVSMYDQVGQFGKAIELLYSGMKSGKIEATLKNWQVLAYFYQQVDQPDQAIKVLKEAEETPEYGSSGEIDRQIADLYYTSDNTQGVYDYCTKAVAKGNHVKNPYTTFQLLAYAAYELRKYPEALKAVDEALKYPEAPAKDLARLKEGIQDAISQQEAEKAAAESERRSL